jgi:hypothetical protein
MVTTAITNITIIGILTIFSMALFANVLLQACSATSVRFIYIFVLLILDKTQFLPDQIMFHLYNQTSGAIETISNETGKDITRYFKYTQEQNTVTISKSTIYIHYNLQIPSPSNPNAISIERVNRAFNVQYIVNPDPRFIIPSTTYFGELYSKFSSINGITYNKINIQVIIPHDLYKYQSLMVEYASMNK